MQLVGLTYLEDGQEKLTESALGSPSGRQLAEAFEELIENTTYFRSWRDSNEVLRGVLEEYGRAACVCERADAMDGEVLRRALLQPNPPEPDAAYREVHLSRTRTLTLIFEALSQSGTEYMNDLAWRNLHFYGYQEGLKPGGRRNG
jgi:hypothetical protein